MEYIQYIEKSQTWKCPKSGKWKATCVGGGGSGGGYYSIEISRGTNYTRQYQTVESAGGSTSFGSYLTAYGATALDVVETQIQQVANGNMYSKGENGYNGLSSYGTIELDHRLSRTGYGFGAGGGCIFCPKVYFCNINVQYNDGNNNYSARDQIYLVNERMWSGSCGEVRVGIFDLNENDEIPCTIGDGGSITIDTDILTAKCQAALKTLSGFITNNYSVISASIEKFDTSNLSNIKNSISPGKDGAIILQYLGG